MSRYAFIRPRAPSVPPALPNLRPAVPTSGTWRAIEETARPTARPPRLERTYPMPLEALPPIDDLLTEIEARIELADAFDYVGRVKTLVAARDSGDPRRIAAALEKADNYNRQREDSRRKYDLMKQEASFWVVQ